MIVLYVVLGEIFGLLALAVVFVLFLGIFRPTMARRRRDD